MSKGSAIALVAERLVEPVEAMHQAISSRGFRSVGPIGRPVHAVHDTVAGAVYASIRVGAVAIGAAIDRSPAGSSPPSKRLMSFLNALWGDELGRHEPGLSLGMTILTASGSPTVGTMSRESAASHLVVLVHGLGQTEDSWRCPDRTDLVDHLAADPTLAPLLVRYNTGRSVVTNGQALADLLEVTVASWPVDVERITIIGHSLGGLVARSACLAATNDDHAWLYRVEDLITTGTPHTGAPAEKAANVAAWGLGIARVTCPLAAFTNRRSRGIKDLRFGAIHESDWGSIDPDALLRNAATSHRLPPTVAHHVIATTVAGAVESPAGWAIGDGMVRTASATAPRGTVPKSVSTTGGVAHGSIQRDERVVHRILDILGAGTAP